MSRFTTQTAQQCLYTLSTQIVNGPNRHSNTSTTHSQHTDCQWTTQTQQHIDYTFTAHRLSMDQTDKATHRLHIHSTEIENGPNRHKHTEQQQTHTEETQ